MRLFEALVEASQRPEDSASASPWRTGAFAEALPLAILSCIDPRLNALLPRGLRIPEDEFVWLRNPGNVITGPSCQMLRSLVWGCAIKQVKEVAIIGHTDCQARQLSTLELMDRLRAFGVERARLPDNPRTYFGLFASEEQNVRQGVEYVRQNGLLGPRRPVHGLMVDTETGCLSWVVNGYANTSPVAQPTAPPAAAPPPIGSSSGTGSLPALNCRIGDTPPLRPVSQSIPPVLAKAPPSSSPRNPSPRPPLPTRSNTDAPWPDGADSRPGGRTGWRP